MEYVQISTEEFLTHRESKRETERIRYCRRETDTRTQTQKEIESEREGERKGEIDEQFTWLLSISPEQKYSAGIMHRVDIMRINLLK